MFRTGSTTGLRGHPHSLQEIQLRQDSIQQLSFQLHDNDAMLVDDIDRAKPKENAQAKIVTRETMKLDDIEGTKAKPRHQARARTVF